MARKSSAKNEKAVSASLAIDLNLDDLIAQAEETMVEKPRTEWGFLVDDSTPSEILAGRFLDKLRPVDGKAGQMPFKTVEMAAGRMVPPVMDETEEARSVKVRAFSDQLFSAIRRGAVYAGFKTTVREDGSRDGEWLKVYVPAKRPRKDESGE